VTEPEWLDLEVVLEIHQKLIARFGGSSGLRDPGLLDSALARPKWLYELIHWRTCVDSHPHMHLESPRIIPSLMETSE